LQSHFRLVTIEVEHGDHGQGCSQGERVSYPFSQGQCLSPDRQSGIGVPEQPIDLRTHVAGAGALVVTAIKLAMVAVPFGIVEAAAGLAVATRGCGLAGE